MADEEQIGRFQGNIDDAIAASNQLKRNVEEGSKLIGAEVSELQQEFAAQKAKLSGLTVTGGQTTADINAIRSAEEQLNAVKRRGHVLDLQALETIQAQNRAWVEQQVIVERLQSTPRTAAERQASAASGAQSSYAAQRLANTERLAAEAEVQQRVAGLGAARSPYGLVLPTYGTSQRMSPGEEAAAAAEERKAQAARQALAAQEAQLNVLRQQEALEQQIAAAEARRAALVDSHMQSAYVSGTGFANRGRVPTDAQRKAWMAGPVTAEGKSALGDWSGAEAQQARYQLALGQNATYGSMAGRSTDELTTALTREGIATSEASNALRKHGALTTEYLTALARGETTVSEFGYQISATVAKFAGWGAAAAGVYGAVGALAEFGRGAIDTASSVQQLNRTLDTVNPQAANQALQGLSKSVNVSMKEAGDAVFQFSRTFNNLPDAVTAAGSALATLKLDNVSLTDAVNLDTVAHQQFGLTAQGMGQVYDMLSAGQREYNSRISQLIPLLGASAGAVGNAGGNLNQLVQLGVYAQRIAPTIGGSRIGTAIYRSAATQLSTGTTQGLNDRAVLTRLGVAVTGNYTQTLQNAILRSTALNDAQRQQMAIAIFGKQYGGRLAGLFSPGNVPLFEQIIGRSGDPRRAITPEATKGSLQTELDAQLATTREKMHSLSNELQRLGAAIGDSGIVSGFNTGLSGLVGILSGGRGVLDGFAGMAGPIKETVLVVEALAAALLFLNRTRFGSSLADAIGVGARGPDGLRRVRLSSLPGVGASGATRARFELRVGTRAAQDAVEADIQASNQALIRNSAEQLSLRGQIAAIQAQEVASDEAATIGLERQNALEARISALSLQRGVLIEERNAQVGVQQALATQQTGLRNRRGPDAMTNEEVLAFKADVEKQTSLEAGAGGWTNRFATNAGGAAGAAGSVEQEAMAGGMFARLTQGATGAAKGLFGFITSIDPMLIAMIGLPIVLGEISSAMDKASAAAQQAKDAMHDPVTSLVSLAAQIAALRKAASAEGQSHVSSGPMGILQNAAMGWGDILGIKSLQRIGGDPSAAASTAGQAQQLQGLQGLYTAMESKFGFDATFFGNTDKGRQHLIATAQQMRQRVMGLLSNSGLPSQEVAQLYSTFSQYLHDTWEKTLQTASTKNTTTEGIYQADLQMDPTVLTKQLQAYEDAQKIFGNNDDTMRHALAGYAALATTAAKPENQGNDSLFQNVATAQSNYVNAVTKDAQDKIRSASLASSPQEAMGDLTSALAGLRNAENNVHKISGQLHLSGQALKAMQQLIGLIGQTVTSASQQMLSLMDTQTQVKASAIQGISPEADISRAQVLVSGYTAELARAHQNHMDPQTIGQLQQKLNQAVQTLNKNQADNARSIADAQGQAFISSDTGITPHDDIIRAQRSVDKARAILALDSSQGRGPAQLAQDQAALDGALLALNQQLQQRDMQVTQDMQSLIDAQVAYQQSTTLSPVQAATDQLRGDIAKLATIKPQDFKTHQEYQAALLKAQAQVNMDVRAKQTAIVDTQMSTLQFQLHTQQITDQQYVQGLENLLKLSKLTQQQRQDILTQIYDTQHQTAVNLNTANIKLPTTYDVRRSILGAMQHGRMPHNSAAYQDARQTNTSNITLNVVVHKDADLKKFAAVLDGSLRTNFAGTAQAMGVI